ncbi:MAG: mannitol dehydrogenase family protein [Synergistaceae bacterium]|nr:mannitol dehydrogenase family protein [Synergistaceae bacterium]MBQ7268063.1 mannitol dehydrogenase family protein [Synergistaceae bacterium]
MRLNYNGLKDTASWKKAGIDLPPYDPEKLADNTRKNPRWVHFGIGNIFRIFIGGIADSLIRKGLMETGIICAETFDFDVVDNIYKPFDNLALAVTLHEDGKTDKRVLGSLTEAVKAQPRFADDWARLKEIFTDSGLQMVSFTITEKGYALHDSDGNFFPFVNADIENGPEKCGGAMAVVASMLFARFKAGAKPLALVSMDNVSQNGRKLRKSVIEMSEQWQERNFVPAEFVAYVKDEKRVSFPWSMIDKITPRPSEDVAKILNGHGVQDMNIVVTSKKTYIAPFVNAEAPGYLVIEDSFPNGRPKLEESGYGVYMADRKTVNLSERMKVTACLNPIHSALCTYAIMLGYRLFADCTHDPELSKLAHVVGYDEGLPVVEDPKIISPAKFLDECMNVRFPNPYLGDTSARIATDISQGLAIRFGETVKEYVSREGSAGKLRGIPLAIAGWLRYILGVDDKGEKYELSPDPMNAEMTKKLEGVTPENASEKLKPILSNANIFGVNFYDAGLGEKIETIFKEEISGNGAVRATLKKYLG